mgnify:CR=1 FL=1
MLKVLGGGGEGCVREVGTNKSLQTREWRG